MLLLISGVFELQGPFSKGNLPRFLWNVMALGTARGQPGGACDPFKKLCPDGQVREAAGGGGRLEVFWRWLRVLSSQHGCLVLKSVRLVVLPRPSCM